MEILREKCHFIQNQYIYILLLSVIYYFIKRFNIKRRKALSKMNNYTIVTISEIKEKKNRKYCLIVTIML